MATVTIHHAKTNLSKLIARVEAVEEIVIARGATPVVRLARLEPKRRKRPPPGLFKDMPPVPDGFFFDPLPDDDLKLYERGDDDSIG
jgi:antitoxin (DNA-binding transcriptional repressor) of toxin-antitoxin stability system